MSNAVALTPIQQKVAAWSTMAIKSQQIEDELKIESAALVTKLSILPTTIEGIPEAEVVLKTAKADLIKLQEKRKTITSVFDGLATRLMLSEKSLPEPIETYSKAIIALKRTYELEQGKVVRKEQEIKQMREKISNFIVETEARWKTEINTLIGKAYNYALDNITPEKLKEYLEQVEAKMTIGSFTYAMPHLPFSEQELSEKNALVASLLVIDPIPFYELWKTELFNRFSDYSVAYLNIASAKELAKKEAEEDATRIENEKKNSILAAKIEAVAVPLDVTQVVKTKALKNTYEIEMSDTVESMLVIMAAFAANINLCMPRTSTKKWLSFTAESAGKTLAKVKSDDNNFAPAGIVFKNIDKL